MQIMPCFVPVLARLGDSWEVPDDLMDDLGAFTCVFYANDLSYVKQWCNKTDFILTFSKRINITNLRPCRKRLEQTIKHVKKSSCNL